MIVFECANCKTKMQAAEEHAGQTTVCPQCNTTATIPAAAGASGAITADPSVTAPASAPAGAIITPEQTRPARKRRDDDEDDRPRRRDGAAATTGAAAAGMGVGMILLLVVGIGGCVLCVPAILIGLLVPAVQKVREAAARTQTMNHMKQIALAEHSYADTMRGVLPGPKMQSMQAPGQPVDLSWRVSILPYIEQAPLFQQFNTAAGWDHPGNQNLLRQRPKIYESAWRPEGDQTQTVFQYFTGPDALFPDSVRQVRITEVPDGLSNTFLFAEAQAPVPWTKPADMAVTPGPLPLPPDRFLAGMGDSSVRFVDRRRVNDQLLRLLIDPRDGQRPPMDWDQ